MKQTLILCLTVTTLIVVGIFIHVGIRLYAINKIMDNPLAYERMKVMPRELILSPNQVTKDPIYSIGYASFASPMPIEFEAGGSKHTAITGESEIFKLLIMPPHLPIFMAASISDELEGIDKLPANHPWRLIIGSETDTGLDSFIHTEEATLRPFSDVMFMGKDEFSAYLFQLWSKSQLYGVEVISYSSPFSRGLVRIYQEKKDRVAALCAIESNSRHLTVGFNFFLSGGDITNSFEIIEPILASLKFDDDIDLSIDNISNIIFAAGINPKQTNHNQQVEPTPTTPVDSVKTNSGAAHP